MRKRSANPSRKRKNKTRRRPLREDRVTGLLAQAARNAKALNGSAGHGSEAEGKRRPRIRWTTPADNETIAQLGGYMLGALNPILHSVRPVSGAFLEDETGEPKIAAFGHPTPCWPLERSLLLVTVLMRDDLPKSRDTLADIVSVAEQVQRLHTSFVSGTPPYALAVPQHLAALSKPLLHSGFVFKGTSDGFDVWWPPADDESYPEIRKSFLE